MNKRASHLIALLLTSCIFGTTTPTKQWIEYPDFDNSNSWQSGYLPCSQDEIVFPESYSSAILLSTAIDVTGITLPKDGALLLPPDSTITFSSGIDNGRKCKNSNQVAKLKATPSRNWFDPHNWRDPAKEDTSSSNAAVPHIERIPCNNELVRIPATGPLSIDLSDVRALRVGQVNLAGSDVSKEFMESLFKSELGEVMFKYASLTKMEYNNDSMCVCHQEDVLWEYEWNVCQHVNDICERPKCLKPIQPIGHCCAVCGVMLKLYVDKCDPSYEGRLSQMIENSIAEQEMEAQLRYHVSFMPHAGDGNYLQAIIVENGDYDERSVKFLSAFNKTVKWDMFQGNKKQFFTAGRPYNPNRWGAALLMIMGTLLGVMVFFAVIFVNFVPENDMIRLPRWMYVRWYDMFRSPFVFARFENTAATDGDTAETVAIDVQQYNVTSEYSERTEGTSTSFDNPMFVENPPAKSASQDDDDIPLREEDLTEIDLETEIGKKL